MLPTPLCGIFKKTLDIREIREGGTSLQPSTLHRLQCRQPVTPHCLQHRNVCKIQRGHHGFLKWPTWSRMGLIWCSKHVLQNVFLYQGVILLEKIVTEKWNIGWWRERWPTATLTTRANSLDPKTYWKWSVTLKVFDTFSQSYSWLFEMIIMVWLYVFDYKGTLLACMQLVFSLLFGDYFSARKIASNLF